MSLRCVGGVSPIGGDEWDMVERNHAKFYPELKRTKESLRRKFSSMYRERGVSLVVSKNLLPLLQCRLTVLSN